MIINIRGMNGSGKSHAVRGVLAAGLITRAFTYDEWQAEMEHYSEPMEGSMTDYVKKPTEIICTTSMLADGTHIVAVGRYNKPTAGCDLIAKQDMICNRIREFSWRFDAVLFEGIVPSSTHQRYVDLFTELHSETDAIIAYLDPTFEECLEYIAARRLTSVIDRKPVNERTLLQKHNQILRTRPKFEAGGFDVRTLPRATSVGTLLEWIHD